MCTRDPHTKIKPSALAKHVGRPFDIAGTSTDTSAGTRKTGHTNGRSVTKHTTFPLTPAVHMCLHAKDKAGLGGAGEKSNVENPHYGGCNDNSPKKKSQPQGSIGERKKKCKP